LSKSTPSETKPEVVRLDDLGRLFRPDQVKQRGVEALSCEFHELAAELSCRLPAFTMRLGKVTANETAATVSMKCRAANDRVGRQIETWSVIIAAGESSLNASFRSVFKGPAVRTVIHDVETEVHELQLV
jgi:hypothetical protein